MRKNQKKPILGFIGLIIVVIMTVIALLIPSERAAAIEETGSVTDTIKVVIYDKFPSITITSLESDEPLVNPEIPVDYTYENIDYVDFTLSYVDEEGNTITIPLEHFEPDDLDEEFQFASGNGSFTFNLKDLGLDYGEYVITATSHSPIGFSEDILSFYYLPSRASQTGVEEVTNDPIVLVEWDDEVEKIEVMAYDDSGNPLFDHPIIVAVPSPYDAGSEEVTLPFSSYGIPSGTNYYVELTAYKHITTTDDDGNLISVLSKINAPTGHFNISYTKPIPPDIPDTGRMISSLSITQTDLIITLCIAMAVAIFIAIMLLTRSTRKKDYRKYYRRRK